MTGRQVIATPAGGCPRSLDSRPHTWQPGDSADLVSYDQPDHGLSVYLGRCQYCGMALLRLACLTDEGPGQACYKLAGVEL